MSERPGFYMDVHVPRAVSDALRLRGIKVITAQEANMVHAQDPEHLAYATRAGLVMVTQDRDFLRLNASGEHHAGIAYARQGTPTGRMLRSLLVISANLTREQMVAHVEFL